MKLLACLGCLAVAIVFGHLLQKAIERIPHRHTEPLPDALFHAVWLECPTTECAHLETPHERIHRDLLACSWCGRIVDAPKKWVRRG